MSYGEYYDLDKEKREAIDAGERALVSLRNAQSELNSARSWGFIDMFGGGLISSYVKHSKMNNASDYMNRARYDLQAFSRELEDVSQCVDLDFNTGDFITFADYFFDGFLADYLVQERINKARAQVNEAIVRVQRILDRLRRN